MKLNAVAAGTTVDRNYNETDVIIKKGDVFNYVSHLPGGNIKIRTEAGRELIADPRCFKELR